MRLTPGQDAFGQALWDGLQNLSRRVVEIVERDDGYIDLSADIRETYLQSPAELHDADRATLAQARGRVLDVGCGAGRHALAMQAIGREVVAIDASPLAVRTAQARGVRDARVLGIDGVNANLGPFDTITMLGNNFGLFANPAKAVRLLRRFAKITSSQGQVLAQSLDVYQTQDPDHLAYLERNRRRGRIAGQIRIRIRYRAMKTPWFDYLMVSREEMRTIAAEAGWRLDTIVAEGGPNYCAKLVKASR